MEYIFLNDQYISQLYYAISGVYRPNSIETPYDVNETCKFETNGYEWIISDGGRKYYCSNNVQLEIPANSELFNPGHYIIRSVPTKSARF